MHCKLNRLREYTTLTPEQYLGIPLALGIITRFTLLLVIGSHNFHHKFLPYFSPLALAGLLYTIIVIFAQQARHILDNIGPVFRTIVPMLMYFAIMFFGTFAGMWWWSNRTGRGRGVNVGYEEAVVQSFTAASNNFVSMLQALWLPWLSIYSYDHRNYPSLCALPSLVPTRTRHSRRLSDLWWRSRLLSA
jgi:hypothetical protein